jgi:hypothetical protein
VTVPTRCYRITTTDHMSWCCVCAVILLCWLDCHIYQTATLDRKVKAIFAGFIRHRGFVKPIVPSPLELPSFTTRGAVYQSETQHTLLAEEGTNGIWPALSEFTKRAGFFNMPQSWDMGQILLLPLRRKACCGFFPAGKIRQLRSGANP